MFRNLENKFKGGYHPFYLPILQGQMEYNQQNSGIEPFGPDGFRSSQGAVAPPQKFTHGFHCLLPANRGERPGRATFHFTDWTIALQGRDAKHLMAGAPSHMIGYNSGGHWSGSGSGCWQISLSHEASRQKGWHLNRREISIGVGNKASLGLYLDQIVGFVR